MTTTAPANGSAPAGPGRGRRAVATSTPVPAPAAAPNPEPIEDQSDPKRTFVEDTDERVLALVHTFNGLGYEAVVTFQADGTKVVTV